MSEQPPVAPPEPATPTPPVEQPRSTSGQFLPKTPATPPATQDPEISLILNAVETDLITELKGTFDLEPFTTLNQAQRIKLMRALKSAKPKLPIEQKEPEVPANQQKGTPKDPTTPPIVEENPYISNLKRNNLREWTLDMNKKNSIHNLTNQIRGK